MAQRAFQILSKIFSTPLHQAFMRSDSGNTKFSLDMLRNNVLDFLYKVLSK